MSLVLAIDPGSSMSAWVELDGRRVVAHAKEPNAGVLTMLRSGVLPLIVVIEDVEPRQQPLGREVADTLRWVGRFAEAAQRHAEVHLLTRRAVTAHHVDGGTRGADARIRAALIDRFGGKGGRAVAIGTKASPGPLHGIRADEWQALALGLCWLDGLR